MSDTDRISDLDPSTAGLDDAEQSGERLDADKLPAELPDRPIAAFEHGTTEREMQEGESLDDRLAREVPDVEPPLAATAPTPLADDADEDGRDREKDLVAEMPLEEPGIDDSGQPDVGTPAEEAAVRIEEG